MRVKKARKAGTEMFGIKLVWSLVAILTFLAYTLVVYLIGVHRNRAQALSEIESLESIASADATKSLNWLRSRLGYSPSPTPSVPSPPASAGSGSAVSGPGTGKSPLPVNKA